MKTFITLLLSLLAANAAAYDIKNIETFDLKQYQGKVVYLDFWASWCKPCQKSFPWMNDLQHKFPSDSFQVVTINVDRKNDDMMTFLKNVPADFTIYHDPSGSMAQKFQLPAMPTSFIIDKTGKAVKKHVGFYSDKIPEMEADIEALL